MSSNNPSGDCKTKTGSASFMGNEGLKDGRDIFGINS